MREVLDKLLALSPVTIEVREDLSKHRPVENLLVLGSNRKLVEVTGYQPHYSFDQTLADVLADFRTRLAEESRLKTIRILRPQQHVTTSETKTGKVP